MECAQRLKICICGIMIVQVLVFWTLDCPSPTVSVVLESIRAAAGQSRSNTINSSFGLEEGANLMATKLYVGNLSYNTTEDQLREVFAGIGEVDSVALITDRHSGQSKGFAFVEMSKDEESKTAIAELNGKEIDGRALNVSEAKPREDRRPSSGGYNRSGGYRASRF